MYDAVIIGAGVNGAAAARALSGYRLKLAVLERASDVCEGTSKANSGIIHAGYDAKPGTLKAKLNVRGSEMMEELSKELGFFYRRCGAFVVCFDEAGTEGLRELKKRGEKNGVKELRIIDGSEARELEPNLSKEVFAALYAPSGAVADPFGMNIALAENAAVNGAEFHFLTEVTGIERIEGGYRIFVKKTPSAAYEAVSKIPETLHIYDPETEYYDTKTVINAAGVYADRIHNMISAGKIGIVPRRGEYMLLDNTVGDYVGRTIFQLPGKLGKGILVTPTVHGNILVGPTAENLPDREDTGTSAKGLEKVKNTALLTAPELPLKEVITSFSGLRAHLETRAALKNREEEDVEGDFMLGEIPDAPGFFDMAGMESPGLSCAPAAGEYIAGLVRDLLRPEKDPGFHGKREAIPNMAVSSEDHRKELIAKDGRFANIICRCCTVSEGELVNAIRRPLGATTSDGLKRRTGAGMGRCQAGFCNPRAVEILTKELDITPGDVCKNDPGSEFLAGGTEYEL
ncbi:MAG: NAD(P)/FAD-dependent oxidoreductase [Lachnospiraceae bacterium]|nr:NAD(P)/FAD-dependent oxidoreductase [Lachnospiraceae bacterium]